MFTFTQLWGSTALGFEGWGGQAITEERTWVFVPLNRASGENCLVYFRGRFAYSVPECEALWEDIKKESMTSVSQSAERYKKGE